MDRTEACECGEGVIVHQYLIIHGRNTGPWEDCYPDEHSEGQTIPCSECGSETSMEELEADARREEASRESEKTWPARMAAFHAHHGLTEAEHQAKMAIYRAAKVPR
jgi:hypothetical protein